MRFTFRPYNFNDILFFNIRPEQDEVNIGDYNSQQRKNYSWRVMNATEARTYGFETDSGFIPVFICGYDKLNNYNADIFFVFDSDIKNNFRKAPRAILQAMKDLIEYANMERLQTFVVNDFEDGKRFIEYMGFKPEGVLKKYTYLGKDVCLYSYLREDDNGSK